MLEKYADVAHVNSLLELANRHSSELKYSYHCIAVFGKRTTSLLRAAEGQQVACPKACNASFAHSGDILEQPIRRISRHSQRKKMWQTMRPVALQTKLRLDEESSSKSISIFREI